MFEVSVIIPVYNCEKHIEECVNSVLVHSCVKQIIIIDDCSTDQSISKVEELSKLDSRIELIKLELNVGAAQARNEGLNFVNCEFIAFLDSDDLFKPNRFDFDIKAFKEDPKFEGSHGIIDAIFESYAAKQQFSEKFPYLKNNWTGFLNPIKVNELFDNFLIPYRKSGHIHLNALTIKKEVINDYKLSFESQLRLHQDTEFIFRLVYSAEIIQNTTFQPIASRRMHDNNRITKLSNNSHKNFENRKLLFNSLFEWSQKSSLKYKYQVRFESLVFFYHFQKFNSISRNIRLALFLIFNRRFIKFKRQSPELISLSAIFRRILR